MAKIGTGTNNSKVSTKNETKVETPIAVPTMSDGSVDYAALYDTIDATKTAKVKHTTVTAAQIREVRDHLFASGKETIAIATLATAVDKIFGLKKEGDVDTRVQNSSVRSAVIAKASDDDTRKFEVVTIDGKAVVRKVE